MVTKLAGPFSDTCRFSTSPRSRLRLRPARRAALTMTLMRAECSMISAWRLRYEEDDGPIKGLGLGALRLRWRQGGSSAAEPFAHGGFRPAAFLGAQVCQGFVKRGVALPGGFRDHVPFEGLNPVDRRPLSARQHAREAVLGDRIVLSGRLAQQRDRGGFVLRRAAAV